jgi:inhibitor of KinA
MATSPVVTMEPLGDRTILCTCKDEASAQQWAAGIRAMETDGIENVVLAYHSLAVHLDTRVIPLSEWLGRLKTLKPVKQESTPKLHIIPCCYELGEDLELVALQLNLSPEQLVEHHTATTFTIYAIGFSPGFPYLGWLPEPLQGIKRRSEPRLKVPAGSVAIVGKQSAIYPTETPGGWALLGRTPKTIVHVEAGYFPLSVGDQVKFERMTRHEFIRFSSDVEASNG